MLMPGAGALQPGCATGAIAVLLGRSYRAPAPGHLPAATAGHTRTWRHDPRRQPRCTGRASDPRQTLLHAYTIRLRNRVVLSIDARLRAPRVARQGDFLAAHGALVSRLLEEIMDTERTPWQRWIEAYAEKARRKQRRTRGIESYLVVLRRLWAFAGDRPLSPGLVAAYLDSREISATTANFEITVIGQWGQFLRGQGEIDVDLIELVERPRRRRMSPLQAPATDVAAVAEWICHGVGHERDRRLAGLCLYTALRISEAVAVRWEHVDLLSGELHVADGKGGHHRTVFMPPPLRKLLSAVPPNQRVGAVAGKRNGECLGPKAGAHVFERVIPRLIGVRLSPHALRRACATKLDEQGRSLRVIQEVLGHADLKTTARYIGVDRQRMRDAMDGLDEAW